MCMAPEVNIHVLLVHVVIGSFKRSLAVVLRLVAFMRDLCVGQALALASKMLRMSMGSCNTVSPSAFSKNVRQPSPNAS